MNIFCISLVKFSLVVMLTAIIGCEQPDFCFDCGNELLVEVEDDRCICKEGYLQLGSYEVRRCGSANTSGQTNSSGVCIMKSEGTYFSATPDCEICSAITAYDTVIIDFDLRLGGIPKIYYRDGENLLAPNGVITQFYTAPDGGNVILLERINAGIVFNPPGAKCERESSLYGKVKLKFDADNQQSESLLYWYDTFDAVFGQTIPVDSCHIKLWR